MEQQRKNKEFIINYLTAVGGVGKTRELLEKYITDEALISHIEVFETAFPKYDLFIDEMTAEGNRIIIKARVNGTHLGDLGGISPTYKKVDFPVIVAYEIENEKIISHWMLADQMSLMEQLGVIPEAAH
ncbi:MAG TPA: ester cyclase [Panacibacter sp.]|nr:ester cyclase [Panacibacter sp.]